MNGTPMRALVHAIRSLQPRDRRALRLGISVLLPTVGLALGVLPYWASATERAGRLAREGRLLAREIALLAEARIFEDRYAEIERTTLAQAPRLFGGTDLLAASADLGSYIAGHAAEHRVMIQQSETHAPEPGADGLARLRVELRAVSDLEGVAGLLDAIERGSKLVRVEQVLLVPVASAPPAAEEAMSLTATVVGYALVDSATVSGELP